MNRMEIVVASTVGLALTFFMAAFCYAWFIEAPAIQKAMIECDAKGGVTLDHTQIIMVGKTVSTNHNYTCIRRDMVIE